MKFKQFRKTKLLMQYYRVIIYGEGGDKVYDDILPVGVSKSGSKEYRGLLTKKERDYYDSVFKELGDYTILDKEIDNENKIIFLTITKEI